MKNEETVELKVPCEVYSRVVGYFRPIHNWNDGKKEEFGERLCFDEQKSMATITKREEMMEIES